MSTATEPLSYSYHLIVLAPDAARVLLMPVEQAWYLPGFQYPERRFWQEVDHVNARAAALLGSPITTLRCVAIDYERDHELLSKVYAVIPEHTDWQPPPDARWVGREALESLELVPERHRAVLEDWFSWHARPVPSTRPPWYTPGWRADTLAWAAETLHAAGTPLQGPAVQRRTWQRSALWYLPTTNAAAYLKAVPPMFAHEPELTAALAAIAPDRVPQTIGFDRRQGLLLTREQAGTSLAQLREVPFWEAAVRAYAQLQIACSSHVADFRALGVPLRGLADLPQRAQPMLADLGAALPDRPAGLNAEQQARLLTLAPHLDATCAALAAYGLPETLEHGDFFAGQVIVHADRYIFLDWSDSSIAHPFFSLLLFLIEIEDFFPKEPDVRDRLRDAYLEPWTALLPYADLVRAFELAQPLAAVHHALGYYAAILPQMEQRWEMELMLPFYLKMLLRLADWSH